MVELKPLDTDPLASGEAKELSWVGDGVNPENR